MSRQPETPKRAKRSRIVILLETLSVVCVLLVMLAALFIGYVYFQDDQEAVSSEYFTTRLNDTVKDAVPNHTLEVASAGLSKGKSVLNPSIILNRLVLRNDEGQAVLQIPEVRGDLRMFLGSKEDNKEIEISANGAELSLWRTEDGRFSFQNGPADPDFEFGEALDRLVADFFKLPVAKNLSKISLNDVLLTYKDLKTNQNYTLANGKIQGELAGNVLDVSTSFELERPETDPTLLVFSAIRNLGDSKTAITAKFSNADPVALSKQVPALDWLRNINANVDASMAIELAAKASVTSFDGVLDLGAGNLRQSPASRAASFDSAKAYFNYDAKQDSFSFSEINLETDIGNIVGTAQATVRRDEVGVATGADVNMTVENFKLLQSMGFEKDLEFTKGRVAMELDFDPVRIRVSKGIAALGDAYVIAAGDVWAEQDYWLSFFNLRVDQFTASQLKSVWPKEMIPKTRKWIHENVQQGVISDFNGYFSRQKGESLFDFDFLFDGVKTGVVRTLPPVEAGYGFGKLTNEFLTLDLQKGFLTSPSDKKLDMAGTRFHIPDITQRPAMGEVILKTKGDLQGILEVLDSDKFQFIRKMGRTPKMAKGQASADGWLNVPLKKGVQNNELEYSFTGVLRDVSSDSLVKGRKLTAESVDVEANSTELRLKGQARLDGILSTFDWSQQFKNNPNRQSNLKARIDATQKSLQTLGVKLPKGSFSGSTKANVDLTIQPEKAPQFTITSSLVGAGLNVAAIGWSKAKKTAADLKISGSLSEPVDIKSIDFKGAGLTAKGTLDLTAKGNLASAEFQNLSVGKWFSGAVRINGTGSNSTTTIRAKTLDLNRLQLAGKGGSSGGPLELFVDRLNISGSIALTNVTAKLTRKGGLKGAFTGKVNGATAIRGEIYQAKSGTAVRIRGGNAGAVLRAAGLLKNIREGDLTVEIRPTKSKSIYNGNFVVENFRMGQSNAFSKLLDAISLVGLLQSLEKGGIHFTKSKGAFSLRPEGVLMSEVSLVGPSMGMTFNGWYISKNKSLDAKGVITPIYALNGLFERIAGKLFGRQKGEGLFSFTYTMKGKVTNPKVQVNPLSILTPGRFREIFDQKIPTPTN